MSYLSCQLLQVGVEGNQQNEVGKEFSLQEQA